MLIPHVDPRLVQMVWRYEEQKPKVTLACMTEIAREHLLVRNALDESEFRKALMSDVVTQEMFGRSGPWGTPFMI